MTQGSIFMKWSYIGLPGVMDVLGGSPEPTSNDSKG